MASYNRVSLDTDVILLRKIFAFGDGETPVPANTILAAADTGSGKVAFTSMTNVLDATCLPTSTDLPIIFEDIYEKIEGINTEVLSGGVSVQTFNATVADLSAAITQASAAYVTPLAAERVRTDLSFADVNNRLSAITTGISQTPWQLIADLSGTVAGISGDLADLNTFTYSLADTTTSAIIALDASLTAVIAGNVEYTTAIAEDLSGVLSAVDAKIAQLQSGTSTTPTTFTAKVTMKEPLAIDIAGTATAPAITFTRPEEFPSLGSATGIYHPTDGTLAVSCNGAQIISLAAAVPLVSQPTVTVSGTTQLNGVLNVNGAGTMNQLTVTGSTQLGNQLKVIKGSSQAPAIAFTDDLDTGICWTGNNNVSIITGSSPAISAGISDVMIYPRLVADSQVRISQAGTATAPSISFTSFSDTDTGIYHPADNRLVIGVGGETAIDMTSTQVIVGKQLVIDTVGTSGNAALLFGKPFQSGTTFDADTGIYHPEDGKLVLTCNNTDALAATAAEVVVRGLSVTTNPVQINTKVNIRIADTAMNAADPGIHFRLPNDTATGTGLFRNAANNLCLAAGSNQTLTVTPSNILPSNQDYYEYSIPSQSINGIGTGGGWPSGTYVHTLTPNTSNQDIINKYLGRMVLYNGLWTFWKCPVGGLWQITLNCKDDSTRSDHIVIGNFTKQMPICSNKSTVTTFISLDDTLLIAGNYGSSFTIQGYVSMLLVMPMGISITTPTNTISTTLPVLPYPPI
jgi:hypothetical protein